MAIAYVSSGSATGPSGADATLSSFVVNSGEILVAGVTVNETTTDDIASVKWNTTESFTRVANVIGAATGVQVALYVLLNPTAGTHNIVADNTGSQSMNLLVASYSGVNTGQTVNNVATNSLTASSAGSISATVTVGAATSMLIGIGNNNFANGMTVNSPYTIRVDNSPEGSSKALADAIPGSGSKTMTFTAAGTGDWGIAIAEVAAAAETARPAFLLNFMTT